MYAEVVAAVVLPMTKVVGQFVEFAERPLRVAIPGSLAQHRRRPIAERFAVRKKRIQNQIDGDERRDEQEEQAEEEKAGAQSEGKTMRRQT